MGNHFSFFFLNALTMNFFLIFTFGTFMVLSQAEESGRLKKILPVFQVVRFPNDVCVISGGAKNGTCYTAEECSNKGGVNAGSCASGFGVCCTFTIGCGGSNAENNSYFEVTGAVNGECTGLICKQSGVCQIRLDFNTFAISGPSTLTVSATGLLFTNGATDSANGKEGSQRTRCSTDTFSISHGNVPTLCGTLTGEHIYFDATQACHELAFSFGQNAIGTTIPTTRAFSIKVTQIPCSSILRAPSGCTQYYYGSTTGTFSTYNFDQGVHLADQQQVICFRRELGYCRICWNADTITDVSLSGKGTKVVTKRASGMLACGSYGIKGTAGELGGYDAVLIPGALKTDNTPIKAGCQAGGSQGLVSATGTTQKTVCSKSVPFRVVLVTDGFELVVAANSLVDVKSKGFKLRYTQTTC